MRQFDFKIEFIDGHKNAAADATSRFCIYGEEEPDEENEPGIILNNMRAPCLLNKSQSNDGDIRTLCDWILKGERPVELDDQCSEDLESFQRHFTKFKLIEGSVYREYGRKICQTYFKYVVPKEGLYLIFELLHDSLLAGNLTRDNT